MNKYFLKDGIEHDFKKIATLIDKKNADYSSKEDIHTNFKRMATIAKIEDIDIRGNPHAVMAFFIFMKADRIWNIAKNLKQAENETLDDSAVDAYVYGKLLAGYVQEIQAERIKFKAGVDEE